jgi:hypothetical protein
MSSTALYDMIGVSVSQDNQESRLAHFGPSDSDSYVQFCLSRVMILLYTSGTCRYRLPSTQIDSWIFLNYSNICT